MRNYLDGYIKSLTRRDSELATQFIWTDRRSLINSIEAARTSRASLAYRYGSARPMAPVTREVYSTILDMTNTYVSEIYDRINVSANVLGCLNEHANAKVERIESALQELEKEIYEWETFVSSAPASSSFINRDFGGFGLRPISQSAGDLVLLSVTAQGNTKIQSAGGLVIARSKAALSIPFFSDDDGLQVRFTFVFTPGPTDKIKLEPLSGAGSLYIVEARAYGPNGELVRVITSNEQFNRTLTYSIPRTVVARIEIDVLDKTFNIMDDVVGEDWSGGWKVDVFPHPIAPSPFTPIPSPDRVFYNSTSTYGMNMKSMSSDLILSEINDDYAAWGADAVIKHFFPAPPSDILLPIKPPVFLYSKSYYYSCGFKDVVCSSHWYHSNAASFEEITFENGIPGAITLSTDEFLPSGAFINLFLVTDDGQKIPLLPKNREFTSEILKFDTKGRAKLLFKPVGLVRFYMDAGTPIALNMSGDVVMGPTTGLGLNATVGSNSIWALYEPDHTVANIINYAGKVSSYVSESGELGEFYPSIPEDKIIRLKATPYIDQSRLSDASYSPVQVVVDGYTTVDMTNYDYKEEEEYPVSQEWQGGSRKIHYKLRGNAIFFEESIDRAVRVYYEFANNRAKLEVSTGQIYETAAAPVLYSYQMSYI